MSVELENRVGTLEALMADTSRVMRATSLDANRPSREIRRLSLRWRRRQLERGPSVVALAERRGVMYWARAKP